MNDVTEEGYSRIPYYCYFQLMSHWDSYYLTPQWQSSERNLLVTIVQKMDIFYRGILNLEFPNFFFNF